MPMEMLKFFLDAARLCFPWIPERLGRTMPVSWGTGIFVAMAAIALVGFAWKRHRTIVTALKRELERAKAGPTNASDSGQPQKPTPQWKTEYERFPEHGVTYALEYPADEDGDLVAKIRVSEPRCLAHDGAPMAPARRGFDDGLDDLPYDEWTCKACHRTITESINQRLRVEAPTNLANRIRPGVPVV